jgi:hypothetical protein
MVKRLKFEDLLQDQAEQDGGDEALGQLDASFTLMMLTFATSCRHWWKRWVARTSLPAFNYLCPHLRCGL